MQAQWSSSCVRAALRHDYQLLKSKSARQPRQHLPDVQIVSIRSVRLAATQPDGSQRKLSKSATLLGSSVRARYASATMTTNAANPPSTTRPPPLDIPQRGSESLPAHLWKLARTYGTFYKTGVKAIFSNRKLAEQVRKRLQKSTGLQQSYDFGDSALLLAAITKEKVNRSEFQLLKRNAHDMLRVPVFGVLVLIFGEWLPLIMPFTPYLPPLTCRIPSQIASMRDKTEERRRWAFRQGIQEPDHQQEQQTEGQEKSKEQPSYKVADPIQAQRLVQDLKQDHLYHLSCVLNMHGRFWERLQTAPPTTMIRRRLVRRFSYLTQDDLLLSTNGGARALTPEELLIACEERGMDVLGPSDDQLRSQLGSWLKKQAQDNGTGQAMLNMLFRRPNAWK